MSIMDTPYNLSNIANQSGLGNQLMAVNAESGSILGIILLVVVFMIVFYSAHKNGYSMWSCIAVSSFIVFIPAIIGRVMIFNGVPMIGSEIVIFFGLLLALSAAVLKFQGK